MNLLALIPARGGSKGIPRKNIKPIGGKPLIAWSIEAAQQARVVDRIVVTTEDDEIASIAIGLGADVPFIRPVELARDETPGIDPVLHAIEQLPEHDWVLLLQPTSPLRTSADIDGIVAFCQRHSAPVAVSVCPTPKHPYWMYRLDDQTRLRPLMPVSPSIACRQDLPEAYALNGALYLARCDWLREKRKFISHETIGYFMPAERSVDIDTPLDWQWVEFLMNKAQ